jgi:hypothetical protein
MSNPTKKIHRNFSLSPQAAAALDGLPPRTNSLYVGEAVLEMSRKDQAAQVLLSYFGVTKDEVIQLVQVLTNVHIDPFANPRNKVPRVIDTFVDSLNFNPTLKPQGIFKLKRYTEFKTLAENYPQVYGALLHFARQYERFGEDFFNVFPEKRSRKKSAAV